MKLDVEMNDESNLNEFEGTNNISSAVLKENYKRNIF